MTQPGKSGNPIRISIVDFLNARPLTWGLLHERPPGRRGAPRSSRGLRGPAVPRGSRCRADSLHRVPAARRPPGHRRPRHRGFLRGPVRAPRLARVARAHLLGVARPGFAHLGGSDPDPPRTAIRAQPPIRGALAGDGRGRGRLAHHRRPGAQSAAHRPGRARPGRGMAGVLRASVRLRFLGGALRFPGRRPRGHPSPFAGRRGRPVRPARGGGGGGVRPVAGRRYETISCTHCTTSWTRATWRGSKLFYALAAEDGLIEEARPLRFV